MNESITPWFDVYGKVQFNHAGSDPSQRIEYLLTTGKKPWQKKLFENEGRSVDTSSRLNYLRYPLELLNTPSHMSAMVFEIHDTNPTHLNTARTRLGRLSENVIENINSISDATKKKQAEIEKLRGFLVKGGSPSPDDIIIRTDTDGLTRAFGRTRIVKSKNGQSLTVSPILDSLGRFTGELLVSNLGDSTDEIGPPGTVKKVQSLQDAGIGSDASQILGANGAVDQTINNLISVAGGAGGLAGDLAETVLWGSKETEMIPQEDPMKKVRPSDFTGYRGDSFVEEVTGFKNNTKDVGTRIYLYLPNNIESEYGFEYEDTNMSALDIARLAKVVSESGDQQLAAIVGRKLAMSNLKTIEGLAKDVPILGSAIEDGTLTKFVEAQSRQIANPMAMHLFKEVKRREFTFAYTFLPKSVEEMRNCYRIIHQFKYYAHPATSGHGRFLDYPAEFHIKFYQKSSENKDIISGYLPYIFKCALKGIKVTYGEDSVMSTFVPDLAGAPPTKIGLELQFSELEILTRDRFGDSEWMPGINLPQP